MTTVEAPTPMPATASLQIAAVTTPAAQPSLPMIIDFFNNEFTNRPHTPIALRPKPQGLESSQSSLSSATKPAPRATRQPKTLNFITITGDPDVESRSDRNKRFVRSAAMKHAVKVMKEKNKKVQKPEEKGKKGQTSNDDRDEEQPDRVDGVRQPAQTQVKKIGLRSLNPFSTVVADVLPSEADLARFYLCKTNSPFSIFFQLFCPKDADRIMLPLVMSTPVLYHSILYMATVTFLGAKPTRWTGLRTALQHEQKAIKCIQYGINRSKFPSESVVFATGMLGIAQLVFDRPECGKAHLQGLTQMVRLKGGVEQFQSPTLKCFLHWMHAMQIVALGIIPPIGTLYSPKPANAEPRMAGEIVSKNDYPHNIYKYLALNRIVDINFAVYLERLLNMSTAHKSPWLGLNGFEDTSEQVRRQALDEVRLAWSHAEYFDHEGTPKIDKAAQAAGILYHLLVTGGKDPGTIAPWVDQLQKELTRLHNTPHLLWAIYHGCANRLALVLWMLYCGAVFAWGPQRKWYVQQIRNTSTRASWEITRGVLQRTAYRDEVCEVLMIKVWMETMEE